MATLKVAAASFDRSLSYWDLNKPDEPSSTIDYSKKHKHGVFSIRFVPGSSTEVVTAGDDEKVCMWDMRSKKCVMEADHCHGEKL